MTAQVIFISQYQPDRGELLRRAELQLFLSNAMAGLNNRIRNMPPYWARLEKDRHHNSLREKITVYKNPEIDVE